MAALPVGSSLRFFGNGIAAPELDRVVIALDVPHRPVDVGATDSTIEFWLQALLADNSAGACSGGADAWIYGNIVFDRDVYGNGDHGDYGIALMAGRIGYGASVGGSGTTACGATVVADGAWHHVAVTRRASDGRLEIYVDGALDGAANGTAGDLSYRDGRIGAEDDPFLVLGAEKHDAGAQYPSYNGFLDEVRISTVRRYTASFAPPPRRSAPTPPPPRSITSTRAPATQCSTARAPPLVRARACAALAVTRRVRCGRATHRSPRCSPTASRAAIPRRGAAPPPPAPEGPASHRMMP